MLDMRKDIQTSVTIKTNVHVLRETRRRDEEEQELSSALEESSSMESSDLRCSDVESSDGSEQESPSPSSSSTWGCGRTELIAIGRSPGLRTNRKSGVAHRGINTKSRKWDLIYRDLGSFESGLQNKHRNTFRLSLLAYRSLIIPSNVVMVLRYKIYIGHCN
jgi:hypothetical protein